MNKSLSKSAQSGFTLIELLIVVALLSFLAVFIIPEMSEFNKRQVVIADAKEISSTLQEAQSLAASGVQGAATHILHYRFSFSHVAEDPAGVYRGYRLIQVDKDGLELDPVLRDEIIKCPVCYIPAQQTYDFHVPSGRVDNLAGTNSTMYACYPGQGQIDITIDHIGKITQDDFYSSDCTCDLVSCE